MLTGKELAFSLDQWSVRDPYAWVRVSEWELEPGVKVGDRVRMPVGKGQDRG